MHKTILSALAAGVLLAGAGSVTSAQAAGDDFCHDYAQAAIRQVHEAMDHHRCDRAMADNPARWVNDYRTHFQWCLGAHRDDADRERDARRDTLDHCARY